MIDFPASARPHERAVLIVFHILGVKNPRAIAQLLGHKHTSEVYRALRKFNGITVKFEGNSPLHSGRGYVSYVQ